MNNTMRADLPSDLEIIDNVLHGETKMYANIVRRYDAFLYKIGKTYAFNHQDVQDIMQETYINAFRNLSGFRKESQFKTWLTRIMINNCYHKKKAANFRKIVLTGQPMVHNRLNLPHSMTHTNIAISKELGKILEDSILALPEKYKIVFTLRELNQLNVAETSEVLNISEGNVKARLSRAKHMLREAIEKIYSKDEIFELNLIYCENIVARVLQAIENLPTPKNEH